MNYTRLSRKSNSVIFLLTCLALTVTSCNKDDDPFKNHPPVLIPDECKSYFYFDQGTYWIYADSTSGSIDSVFVEQATNSLDTLYDGQDLIGIYESFTMMIADTNGYGENHRLASTTSNLNGFFRIQRSVTQNGVYVNKDEYAFYPLKDTTINARFGSLIYLGHLDSMQVMGMYYPNVVVFKNTADALHGQQESIRYFAKDVGLIREKIPHQNTVRVLVRKG